MKRLRAAAHAAGVLLAIFLLAVLPFLRRPPVFLTGNGTDAVSGATVSLPQQPSGAFLVLINTSLHRDTLEDWRRFFTQDEDDSVIFDDLRCLAAQGDVTGVQLAERFQAQLPENQMRLRLEDPTLLVSKLETGRFDVAVLSKDFAEAMRLSRALPENVAVIEIAEKGAGL